MNYGSPAWFQNQVGPLMAQITETVTGNDLWGLIRGVRCLQTMCAPLLARPKHAEQAKELKGIPTHHAIEDPDLVFEYEMRRYEVLLQVMTKEQLYLPDAPDIVQADEIALGGPQEGPAVAL